MVLTFFLYVKQNVFVLSDAILARRQVFVKYADRMSIHTVSIWIRSEKIGLLWDLKFLFSGPEPVGVQTVLIDEILHVVTEGFTQLGENGILGPHKKVLCNLGRIGDQLCYDMRIGRISRLGKNADTGILFSQREGVQVIGGPAEKSRRDAEGTEPVIDRAVS